MAVKSFFLVSYFDRFDLHFGVHLGEDKRVMTLTAVDGVDDGKRDKGRQRRLGGRDAVERERDRCGDGHGVLPTVNEVREDVLGIVVTAEALQETPDRR